MADSALSAEEQAEFQLDIVAGAGKRTPPLHCHVVDRQLTIDILSRRSLHGILLLHPGKGSRTNILLLQPKPRLRR